MKHGLPCAAAVIDDRPISFGEIAVCGELCGDKLQLAQHRRVLRRRVGERTQMLPWTDQDVGWRLRVDVLKRE